MTTKILRREPTEEMIAAVRRAVSGYPSRETVIAIFGAAWDAAPKMGSFLLYDEGFRDGSTDHTDDK